LNAIDLKSVLTRTDLEVKKLLLSVESKIKSHFIGEVVHIDGASESR